MKRLLEHFYNVAGRMTPSQIILIVAVVAGLIIGTVMIVGWAKSEYYVPLYSNLSAEDAGHVIDKLQEMGISYEIGNKGTSINVPSSKVYETRMKLASSGLPSAQNIGYALFDQSNLGVTDFVQKVNFRRALEGELAKTITGLSEISAARVHLVIPEEKLFKEDENPPSASVVVKLNGTPLTRRQVSGIAYLVASSVEGMTPDNVTIIDYDGNMLSSELASDPTAALTASQFEMRKNVEAYLEHKAQSLLNSVVGPGHSIVRVTADLNFEQNNTQIEKYDPDQVAIRSEQRSKHEGNETQADSGQPPATTSSSKDNADDVITNYEVSRTVKNIIGEVGSIKRLTVAVMVDGTYKEETSPEGQKTEQFVERTPEELKRLSSIIQNAVGYAEARQDKFEIVSVPFSNNFLKDSRDELDNASKWNTYIEWGKKIGLVLLLIGLFFYGKKKLVKLFKAVAQYMPPPPTQAQMMAEEAIIQKPQKPKLIDTMKEQTRGKNEEIAKVIKTIMTDTE